MADSDVAMLLRVHRNDPRPFAAAAAGHPLRALMGIELEPLFETPAPIAAAGTGLTVAGSAGLHEWYVARPAGTAGRNPWEVAHEMFSGISAASLAATATPDLIEPDLVQQWEWGETRKIGVALSAAPACVFTDQNTNMPFRTGEFAWHLTDAFSELGSARDKAAAASGQVIRIAHLDTGYDANHKALANVKFLHAIERNFVDDNRPSDARDLGVEGTLRNPGHGTGTLGILAGSIFEFKKSGYSFNGILGGAPNAEIVPIRVGNSVVQLTTSTVARGINYAVELCADEATRIHVISMSMGGVASAAWADAVNKAYEAGILFVAAAGNNFSAGFFGFPTHQVVYPARFRRVLAACGVMANKKPYYGLSAGTMQGNWGPEGAMATALSAYTPNTPWAHWGCSEIVRMDGAGTSSATPQIAAAAALYLQCHAATLFDKNKYAEPWMRVEAVRQALFRSADATADAGSREKLGNGILRANSALNVAPIAASALRKMAVDSAGFPFLNVLSGSALARSAGDAMLELEATQLIHNWQGHDGPNPLEKAIADPDRPAADIPQKDIESFLEAVAEHRGASQKLRERASKVLVSLGHATKSTVPGPGRQGAPPAVAKVLARKAIAKPPAPSCRKLRGYAVDPSLSSKLDTAKIAEVTFRIPWETLAPGPSGEYVEVMDIDPASGTFYQPVDLNTPDLLAQDGLPPSEGSPQFHQQMVYAVSSLTIRNFESALGRKILWRPGPPPPGASKKDDSQFVKKLRIYPHALREANAYYSPNKVALLFGYFDSINVNDNQRLPGGRVFTCLSHDIIAHETTHAMLDGMHRRLLLPSNPDVLAFHEGFADCVAMLQHFTFPDLVAHQIRATRGNIDSTETMLTQLAIQFGITTGQRTALRDATGGLKEGVWQKEKPNPADYLTVFEPHDRGRILVAIVFDAFLSIYRHRTSDLIRLATSGTGVLQPGEIHPDLVQRLSEEASKSAQHVLTMCIRALDYCPPTDITFGEYLRAIITADCDLVEDDNLNYRVSFIEAFHRRGIFPPGVRTLSVDSLRWRTVEEELSAPSDWLKGRIGELRRISGKMLFAKSREEVFFRERNLRLDIHNALKKYFRKRGPDQLADAKLLGIDPSRSFEVHSARFAFRHRPDGGIRPQLLIGLLQTMKVPVNSNDASPKAPQMEFEGGCVIVTDLYTGEMRYCIRKDPAAAGRLNLQREFAVREIASLRSTYLGKRALDPNRDGDDGDEPFALVHRGH